MPAGGVLLKQYLPLKSFESVSKVYKLYNSSDYFNREEQIGTVYRGTKQLMEMCSIAPLLDIQSRFKEEWVKL